MLFHIGIREGLYHKVVLEQTSEDRMERATWMAERKVFLIETGKCKVPEATGAE